MSNAAGIPHEKDVKECPVEKQITWRSGVRFIMAKG
jgi:hypothetical protein